MFYFFIHSLTNIDSLLRERSLSFIKCISKRTCMSELNKINNTATYSKEQGRERSKREDSQNWISFDEQEPFCFNSVFLTDGKKVWFDKSYEWSTYSSEYAEDKGPTHWISPLSLLPFIEESLKKRFICQHPCEMRCSEHCGNTVRDK